jgi:hypothetical protein
VLAHGVSQAYIPAHFNHARSISAYDGHTDGLRSVLRVARGLAGRVIACGLGAVVQAGDGSGFVHLALVLRCVQNKKMMGPLS